MKSFEEFDKDFGFTEKVGFRLTKKQEEAVNTGASYDKLLLNLEVGVGKTVMSTAIALIQGLDRVLVVVPPILISPWVSWLKSLGTVTSYRGTPAKRKELDLASSRFVVMSHAIFRQDFERVLSSYQGENFGLIVDEAQALKSPKSILFKSVLRLSAGKCGLQLLTGTPMASPLDAYSYIKLKTPKTYRSYHHFESLHVAKRDFFDKPVEFCNMQLLKDNFDAHSITGTKEDFHGTRIEPMFPDCSYDLDKSHLDLYNDLVNDQLLQIDSELLDVTTSQRLYQALQQVVCNWAHFSGIEKNRSAVYDIIDQTVEETECAKLEKSKLIIWTRAKMTSRSVLRYCNEVLKIKTVAAYSEVDSEKSIKAFLEDPETRILVGQPRSCGAGLNPQHVCWEALYVELDTSSILMRQSIGRIVRIGQKHTPRIKIAVANATIQKSIFNKLIKNDDSVSNVDTDKVSVRAMLEGRK